LARVNPRFRDLLLIGQNFQTAKNLNYIRRD
jgi:hypothetical protein